MDTKAIVKEYRRREAIIRAKTRYDPMDQVLVHVLEMGASILEALDAKLVNRPDFKELIQVTIAPPMGCDRCSRDDIPRRGRDRRRSPDGDSLIGRRDSERRGYARGFFTCGRRESDSLVSGDGAPGSKEKRSGTGRRRPGAGGVGRRRSASARRRQGGERRQGHDRRQFQVPLSLPGYGRRAKDRDFEAISGRRCGSRRHDLGHPGFDGRRDFALMPRRNRQLVGRRREDGRLR